ncbi:AUXI1 [Symbiodinium microadriaticum]|nr:AUXI1 [Symbiodinium microadriaticum]CAE7945684.1 AUXI1 [Symbiodinium sp. KB8]
MSLFAASFDTLKKRTTQLLDNLDKQKDDKSAPETQDSGIDIPYPQVAAAMGCREDSILVSYEVQNDPKDRETALYVMPLGGAISVTVAMVRASFPLPGNYHLRFKAPTADGSFGGCVWIDLASDQDLVPVFNGGVAVKALRLPDGSPGSPSRAPSQASRSRPATSAQGASPHGVGDLMELDLSKGSHKDAQAQAKAPGPQPPVQLDRAKLVLSAMSLALNSPTSALLTMHATSATPSPDDLAAHMNGLLPARPRTAGTPDDAVSGSVFLDEENDCESRCLRPVIVENGYATKADDDARHNMALVPVMPLTLSTRLNAKTTPCPGKTSAEHDERNGPESTAPTTRSCACLPKRSAADELVLVAQGFTIFVAERQAREKREYEEKIKRHEEQKKRDAQSKKEKLELNDVLSKELNDWAKTPDGQSYKEIRTLLSTMHSVTWEGASWQPLNLSELVADSNIKKYYRKAILMAHPDRHQSASSEQQVRADRIFNALNESFKSFTSS